MMNAVMQKVSIQEVKAALADAAGVGLAIFFADPCCLCEATPTVLFSVLSRDRSTFMPFAVCTDCIKNHGLLPN
jgi:hypothetical protein